MLSGQIRGLSEAIAVRRSIPSVYTDWLYSPIVADFHPKLMARNLNFSAPSNALPPQNVDAEESILGGILLDPEAIGRVADVLRPEALYISAHQEIYQAALALHGQGKPTDLMSVTTWLYDHDLLEKVGGQGKLAQLVERTVSAVNIDRYAALVMDKYLRRQLIQAGHEIAQLGYETSQDLETVLDHSEQKIFSLTQTRPQQGLVPISETLIQAFQEIETRHQETAFLPGLPSNFYDLDAMTGGFQRSDLIIIAGRPSMGKTSFAMGVARNIAEKLPVAIFSLEMSKEQLVQRMLASEAEIESNYLRTGRIAASQWEKLSYALGTLSELPIFIDDTANQTVMQMRSQARRLQAERGGKLGLILIDYLQLMEGSGSENRVQELSRITRSLKGLARELGVPVIALSQLSRGVELRTNKRPMMSDLRECVTGDTLVWLADGRRLPIAELVGQMPEVISMNERGCLIKANADCIWEVGTKPVFELTTASGRKIKATGKHRLYTLNGWSQLQDLRAGDRLAVANHMPMMGQPGERWPNLHVILLAHLIGECYTVQIYGKTQQLKFLEVVGAFGPRVEPAKAAEAELSRRGKANPNRDTIPIEVFDLVKTEMKAQGVSQRRMAALRGTSYGGTSHFKFAPTREVLLSYADILSSPELKDIATSDLYWDEIAEIKSLGEETVYDLTVPGPASWMADGIVSHNSGSIEQDADLVIMLYRDEYYHPDTPDRGIAEIIITKHRNGPTGNVKLLFDPQFTRFRNLASPNP